MKLEGQKKSTKNARMTNMEEKQLLLEYPLYDYLELGLEWTKKIKVKVNFRRFMSNSEKLVPSGNKMNEK